MIARCLSLLDIFFLCFIMSTLAEFIRSVPFEKKDEKWNDDIRQVLARNDCEVSLVWV